MNSISANAPLAISINMFYNSHLIYALLADLSMAVSAGSQTAVFIRAMTEESRRGLKPLGKGLAGIGFLMELPIRFH